MADRKEQEIDWANKQEVIMTLPHYMQQRIKNAGVKGITNTVDIELFTLKKPMSTDYLLVDTPLKIEARRRTCLVGDPGSGKSTLFHAIAKKEIKGFPQHLNVWHCQEIEHGAHAKNVIETVVSSHSLLSSLWHAERSIKAELCSTPPPTEERKSLLEANLAFVDQLLSPLHADTAYERAGKMLRVLGFDEEGQKKSTNDLSGGLRMRVALCAAFFVEADLLLLDEPTNHLDFPSVLWLENRLRGYSGSFLLIAHDRELLENTVTSVIHIEDKKLVSYNGDFKTFEKQLAKLWAKKAKEVDRFLMLNRNVDFSSPIAKEKAEKEAWLEAYQRKEVLLKGKFTFPLPRALELPPNPEPAPEGEVSLVNVKDVTFSYNINVEDPFYIFEKPININITTATRMGVMGPNGAGKSTFLKLVTEKLQPITGSIVRHPTMEVAYFAQHHIMDLDLTKTPIEYMLETFPGEKSGLLRSHLGKVGLVGNQVETRMQSLSHGQRSCILFAKITYRCPDMLIMDEPTNFLDMESVDALIGATLKFKGALLLVSHNRGFLNGCVNTYLSITPGRFEVFNNLKDCERATYQFIEEMEGGGGLKAGANSMTNTLTKVKVAAAQPNAIAISIAKPAPAPPKPIEEKKEEKVVEDKPKVVKPQIVCDESLIGTECLAVYKADGREYPAVIKRVFPNSGEVTVEYIGYNENAILKMSCIRIGVKAAPKGRQNGNGQKAGGKQGGNKQQQQNGNKGGNKARAGGQGPRSGGR